MKIDGTLGFALYRLANETTCNYISGVISGVEKLDQHSGFIFTDFNRNNSFLITPTVHLKEDWNELKNQISPLNFTPNTSSTEISTDRDDYDFGFRIVKNEIDYKKINKAVLSRKIVFNTTSNAIELFEKLIINYPSSHIYLVKVPSGDVWVGASPETLITANNNTAVTMSLAGTKNDLNIEWTEKEYNEQNIVTKTITEGLRKLGIEPEVSELETIEAGAVFHLRNMISFSTNTHSVAEIAETLHPTPAISGSPKQAAYSTIKIAEPHNREYYCGFGGPVNLDGKSTLFVNLRCAKISSNQTTLFVGGGITKNSVQDDEWKECERKAQSLLHFL